MRKYLTECFCRREKLLSHGLGGRSITITDTWNVPGGVVNGTGYELAKFYGFWHDGPPLEWKKGGLSWRRVALDAGYMDCWVKEKSDFELLRYYEWYLRVYGRLCKGYCLFTFLDLFKKIGEHLEGCKSKHLTEYAGQGKFTTSHLNPWLYTKAGRVSLLKRVILVN